MEAAVRALRQGGLAIIPTETVYGLATSATPDAAARLVGLRTAGEPKPVSFTWHAPGRQRVLEVLRPVSPLHLRALNRLTPGPVRLLIELDAGSMARVLGELGVASGVIDQGGALALRVPDSVIALDLLTRVGTPVIAERTGNFGLGDGARMPEGIHDRARAMGIAAVIDDGPTRFGTPSCSVRLTSDGGYRYEGAGAWTEQDVASRVERTIVFICTGNTCRSPMAEAIARHVLSERPPPGPGRAWVPIRVESAGVHAVEGEPMTREAEAALRGLGVPVGPHRSRAVDDERLLRAEAVYTMTRAHARELESLAPGLRGRVHVLDPAGQDVPDPIGSGPEQYRRTASALREMIRARLTGLEQSQGAQP
jgi:L-threonylcarbamoyladenylate synthase